MKSVIYETKGKAREYCELAINLYSGCAHCCVYCYGADVTHQTWDAFTKTIRPRVTLNDLEQSAKAWANETRPILMCFVTDPYQPLEEQSKLTQTAIETLHRHNLKFTILTKAGKLAQRDFDLYKNGDSFATTLTCVNREVATQWEPHAGLPHERIANLKKAHELGIKTWVSLEPVIDPEYSLELIELTKGFVDHYKVGKMNYHERQKEIDWASYARKALRLLSAEHKSYYIKKDLAAFIGQPDGIRQGLILP